MRKQVLPRALVALTIVILVMAAAGSAAAATNLALSATASASCEAPDYELYAKNINDGDMATSWIPVCETGPGSWVQLSWSDPMTFSKVVIRQGDGTNNIDTFDISAKIGGVWTPLTYTRTDGTNGDMTLVFSAVTATDLKVTLNSAVGGDSGWISVDISELEVYMVGHTDPTEPDLALAANGGIPSSSGHVEDWANHDEGLNDGHWDSNGWAWVSKYGGGWAETQHYAQINWNSPITFNQITVRFGSSQPWDKYVDWGAHAYRIDISDDGVNWTNLRVGSSIRLAPDVDGDGRYNNNSYGSAVLQTYLPAPITTRYIRVRPSSYYWKQVMITEIEVYNRVNPGWAVITGKVRDGGDTNKAGIPAQLQIITPTINPAWQELFNFDTNDNGDYTLVVDPGDYNLEVRGPGFVTKQVPISANLGQRITDNNIDLDRGTWADFPNATLSVNSDLTINSQGLSINPWGDITPTTTNAGPDNRPCMYFAPGGWRWAGMWLDKNFYSGSCDKAWLTITYLDNRRDSGIWAEEYRASNPPGSVNTSVIQLEGTGQWVTRTIPFDMTFFSRLSWAYDFYLDVYDTYISSMSLSFRKLADYGKLPISITFDSTPVEDGLKQLFNNYDNGGNNPRSDFELTPTTMGGKACGMVANTSTGLLALRADSTRYSGAHDAWVTIEYFDAGTDTFTWGLHKYINASDGTWREYSITKTNTNTWKKITQYIQGYSFIQCNGGDFWLYSNGDGPEYIRSVSISDTMPVDTSGLPSIPEVRSYPTDGRYVTVGGQVVTNTYGPWCYWIEDANRTNAIRVNVRNAPNGPLPTVGQRVGVYGYLQSYDWTGPVIDDAQFVVVGNGDPLKPVAMANKVLSGVGLNPDGMFVRIWGKVTDVSDNTGLFTIDDGSGVPISVDSEDRDWAARTFVPGVDMVAVTGTIRTTGANAKSIYTSEKKITKF